MFFYVFLFLLKWVTKLWWTCQYFDGVEENYKTKTWISPELDHPHKLSLQFDPKCFSGYYPTYFLKVDPRTILDHSTLFFHGYWRIINTMVNIHDTTIMKRSKKFMNIIINGFNAGKPKMTNSWLKLIKIWDDSEGNI